MREERGEWSGSGIALQIELGAHNTLQQVLQDKRDFLKCKYGPEKLTTSASNLPSSQDLQCLGVIWGQCCLRVAAGLAC